MAAVGIDGRGWGWDGSWLASLVLACSVIGQYSRVSHGECFYHLSLTACILGEEMDEEVDVPPYISWKRFLEI